MAKRRQPKAKAVKVRAVKTDAQRRVERIAEYGKDLLLAWTAKHVPTEAA